MKRYPGCRANNFYIGNILDITTLYLLACSACPKPNLEWRADLRMNELLLDSAAPTRFYLVNRHQGQPLLMTAQLHHRPSGLTSFSETLWIKGDQPERLVKHFAMGVVAAVLYVVRVGYARDGTAITLTET